MGFSQEDLAHTLGVVVSTVAGWEQGTASPRARRRRDLAEVLDLSAAELSHLLDACEPSDNGDGVVAGWLGIFASMEQGAAEMQTYEPLVVPALLQTEEYATAVEANHWQPVTEDAIVKRTANRMKRQRVLDRQPNPLRLTAVVDEGVLHRRLGSPATMAAQLDHIVDMAERVTVDVRVSTLDGSEHVAADGPFRVLTDPGAIGPHIVCAIGPTGTVTYHDSVEQVAGHAELFRFLHGRSLGATESIDLIREISTSKWKEG